jgi:hypothetical protein
MLPYSRSVEDAASPIPDDYQLLLTNAVAMYACNIWTDAVSQRLGKYLPTVFLRPKAISGALAEEVRLLAETLANALLQERKSASLSLFRHSWCRRSSKMGLKGLCASCWQCQRR